MLSLQFQQHVFDSYRKNNENPVPVQHGQYEYSIAYNACATIHTWIIRRKRDPYEKWHWYMPLNTNIK